MLHSFEVVEDKILETEFFLSKMTDNERNWNSFKHYLSAYLSASRTTTLAIQRFKDIPGFNKWYSNHRENLKKDPIAKFMLEARNAHVHGGASPVAGATFYQGESKYRFEQQGKLIPEDDIVSMCRTHFVNLLKIVYDCYVVLGVYIDPQQYYTKEHFATLGKNIDDAEVDVRGWVMESFIKEGFDVDDRWQELRSYVGECVINHLFNGYLSKVTPQPKVPEHFKDFEYSYEDRGWVHIPAGFNSLEEYKSGTKEFS